MSINPESQGRRAAEQKSEMFNGAKRVDVPDRVKPKVINADAFLLLTAFVMLTRIV